MTHNLKLQNKPFYAIKNHQKTIEMRLFDSKRKLINAGDEIVFTNLENDKKICCKVLDIFVFKNFDELYKNFDKTELGYAKNEIAKPTDMNIYYSLQQQQEFGVCAIKIKLID